MDTMQLVDPTMATSRIVANRGFDTPFLTYFAVVHGGEAGVSATALKQTVRIGVPDVDAGPIFAGKQSARVLRA